MITELKSKIQYFMRVTKLSYLERVFYGTGIFIAFFSLLTGQFYNALNLTVIIWLLLDNRFLEKRVETLKKRRESKTNAGVV